MDKLTSEFINIENPLITLKDEVIKCLSTDQFYFYKVFLFFKVFAIRCRNIPKDLALLEISLVNHSKWLTTADKLCSIWVTKHELESKDLKNLE